MRRFAVVLGAVVSFLLIGAVATWACCGMGTEPIQVEPIEVSPDPVPCDGDAWGEVTITYTVMVQGYEWPDPGWEWGVTYADVIVDGDVIVAGEYITGMTETVTKTATWTPTEPGTFLVQIRAYNEAGTVTVLQPGPEIVVESCCVPGLSVRVTPQTFNVQRAGNFVMGHLDGAVAGTIVSIGGIATSISGSAEPGGPIRFASSEVSPVAEAIVPEGDPRAEDVEVVVVAELEDGSVSCGDVGDTIDIINEGKKK